MMKKQIANWKVKENIAFPPNYCLLKLTLDEEPFPAFLPGQFVQAKIDHSNEAFLRRPISVHYVDVENKELWLLIQIVGAGTRYLAGLQPNDWVNLIYPLGNGFTIPARDSDKTLLLVGGGVGAAPVFYLGACLKDAGFAPIFLLGARSERELIRLEAFREIGTVYVTTENGQVGEQGYVIDHSLLRQKNHFDFIYACGPHLMMRSVARYARGRGIPCEVSLENRMACGIGACLCCVEYTVYGNLCVCTDGPVFNIDELTWQI
jgi:dihydroorotate dehydrogenase electron transfer subunit